MSRRRQPMTGLALVLVAGSSSTGRERITAASMRAFTGNLYRVDRTSEAQQQDPRFAGTLSAPPRSNRS